MNNSMKSFCFVACIPLLLIGCNTQRYDLEVECWRNPVTGIGKSNHGKTTKFECYAPKFFKISCRSDTVQNINFDYFCSTADGKSVRIEYTNPPENML